MLASVWASWLPVSLRVWGSMEPGSPLIVVDTVCLRILFVVTPFCEHLTLFTNRLFCRDLRVSRKGKLVIRLTDLERGCQNSIVPRFASQPYRRRSSHGFARRAVTQELCISIRPARRVIGAPATKLRSKPRWADSSPRLAAFGIAMRLTLLCAYQMWQPSRRAPCAQTPATPRCPFDPVNFRLYCAPPQARFIILALAFLFPKHTQLTIAQPLKNSKLL